MTYVSPHTTRMHVVLHIPHASTHIPDMTGYIKDPNKEIDLLTDHATDKLFYYPYATVVKAEFSRVFCDVERLPDAEEPMFKQGMGYFYTHCDDGSLLREDADHIKEKIYWDYYLPHHEKLQEATKPGLENSTILFDCHSFSDVPFQRDTNKQTPRPDICIGTDPWFSVTGTADTLKFLFEKKGYNVYSNAPYSGTIVPLNRTNLTERDWTLTSYMIEVNRKLYMTNGIVDPVRLDTVQNDITEVLIDVIDIICSTRQ